MKFSTVDNEIRSASFNPLDLVSFDSIKQNTKTGYPAFVFRGNYIKTITKVPGVDFFNLAAKEQEEKVNYWAAFLASLKCTTQVMCHSVPIETDKYLSETLEQVKNSPYLTEKVKKRIILWLPHTLEYIKRDGETTAYKKEYYIITSCTLSFNGDNLQEQKKELDDKDYQVGVYKEPNPIRWKVFEEGFNSYYNSIFGLLLSCFWDEALLDPVSTEERVIGLFAELNNGIDRNSIPKIKFIL